MNEAEWLASDNARDMLNCIPGGAPSARKARLLAVAFCRCSDRLMRNSQYRPALDLAERFADGDATDTELAESYRYFNTRAMELREYDSERQIRRWALTVALLNALRSPVADPGDAVWNLDRSAPTPFGMRLANLCRDVCGNPFEPINPPWLFADSAASARWLPQLARWRFDERCRTETAVTLARQMYDSREFGAMPILADALQDAGCDNPAILDYCCDANQPHVRGCWVCDLVLGFS